MSGFELICCWIVNRRTAFSTTYLACLLVVCRKNAAYPQSFFLLVHVLLTSNKIVCKFLRDEQLSHDNGFQKLFKLLVLQVSQRINIHLLFEKYLWHSFHWRVKNLFYYHLCLLWRPDQLGMMISGKPEIHKFMQDNI